MANEFIHKITPKSPGTQSKQLFLVISIYFSSQNITFSYEDSESHIHIHETHYNATSIE